MSCNEFHLSYEELLQKFISKNMIVNDKKFALKKLKHISYYKIKEFSSSFLEVDNNYKSGTTFEDVFKNYELDKELRLELLKWTESIELSIKNNISYRLGIKYGWNGYLNFSNWCDRDKFNKEFIRLEEENFKKKLLNKVEKYKESNYVIKKFYEENIDEIYPSVWRICEILTFGEILYLFNLMSKKNKENVAKQYNMNVDEFESYVKHINLIRNLSAHNMPIINIYIKTPPKIPKNARHIVENPKKLVASLIVIINFVRQIDIEYKLENLYNIIINKLINSENISIKYGVSNIEYLKEYLKIKL